MVLSPLPAPPSCLRARAEEKAACARVRSACASMGICAYVRDVRVARAARIARACESCELCELCALCVRACV